MFKKKNKFKPFFKTLIKLRENLQNKKKILKFKKKKWEKFTFHFKKKAKPYIKYRIKDQNLHRVSKFPTKVLSYKKRFKNTLMSIKKFKVFYGGVPERKLQKIIIIPKRAKNKTLFLNEFEKRIDTVLFRSKFCISLRNSRQLISHKQILINHRTVKNYSYKLKTGDLITINPKYYKTIENNIIYHFSNSTIWPLPPKYLNINYKTMEIIFGQINQNKDILSTNYSFNLNLEKIIQNYKHH